MIYLLRPDGNAILAMCRRCLLTQQVRSVDSALQIDGDSVDDAVAWGEAEMEKLAAESSERGAGRTALRPA
jgi:hypothetical protein